MLKAVLLVLFVSVTCAVHIQPDEVEAILRAYVKERAGSMTKIRVGTSTADCYDKYNPLIEETIGKSRNETTKCIDTAEAKRNEALAAAEKERDDLDVRVNGVIASLVECQAIQNTLEYAECLSERTEDLQKSIKGIETAAKAVKTGLEFKLKDIKNAESFCITTAFNDAKKETDKLLTDLQNCLIKGEIETSN